LRTLVLTVSYDGRPYAGWQEQPNVPTVQGLLQSAISKIIGYPVIIGGSGRTDSGVHATEQCAHLELPDEFDLPCEKLIRAINYYLPYDIAVNRLAIVNFKFHSRFDAISRQYKYYVHTRKDIFKRHHSYYCKFPLNFDTLSKSAEIFLGVNDFTTFSKYNPDLTHNLCRVTHSKWEEIQKDELVYTIQANHFVYGMVRSLVGSMIVTARGKRDIDDLKFSLDLKDRKLNSPLAPAHGLFLTKVEYPDDIKFDWIYY